MFFIGRDESQRISDLLYKGVANVVNFQFERFLFICFNDLILLVYLK